MCVLVKGLIHAIHLRAVRVNLLLYPVDVAAQTVLVTADTEGGHTEQCQTPAPPCTLATAA